MVMHSMGLQELEGNVVGTYERMIDSIAELADYAGKSNIPSLEKPPKKRKNLVQSSNKPTVFLAGT